MTSNALRDLLAKAKARTKAQLELEASLAPVPVGTGASTSTELSSQEAGKFLGTDRYGKPITWNQEQYSFISLASQGKSAILIGAAGTGKTTTMRGAIEELLRTGYFPAIEESHKHLPFQTPGIIAVSYTRRAVMNLRKAMPPELVDNCITIHKLLEYQPEFSYMPDPVNGGEKKTMTFEPNRNRLNPLPGTIKTIIIDESSMVSVDLFHKIWIALPNPMAVQFIFLGDIQQLPPVFGSAILGFKMLKLPVIELTQVYRQALESPIIRLAHRILSGNPIPPEEFPAWKTPGQLTLHPWKKKISADSALLTIAAFFKSGYDSGAYNPEEDMILIPFNKACGTDELNRHIANHIARRKHLTTFEVIAGFNKYYFSVGEKLLYEKEDAILVDIKRNPTYAGTWPAPASPLLDYWGTLQIKEGEEGEVDHHLTGVNEDLSETEEDIDAMLDILSSDVEERVREASHILTIRVLDSDKEVEIKSASEINSLLMAYALTIHKSQGSEWRRVFLMLHQSHNTMIQRELLYTGVTRAKEELYCICEPDSFMKGILGQRIKGNTLEEKAQYFSGKLESGEDALLAEIL